MSALAKLIRLQPRSSLSSFRLQTSRTLSLAARLHRPSLTQAVSSSWSPVSVRYFSTEPEGNDKSQKEKAQPPKRLFVFNVPYDAQNEHLREIFSPYGAIDRVYLFRGRRGGHKGCGHVEFNKSEDAVAAYQSGQAKPFLLMDRTLSVDYARIRAKSMLFFRNFTGNEEDLRVVLEDYKDCVIQIVFMPPLEEGQLQDRGHILFANQDSDTAEEVFNKFNGKMTALGCPMHLEYPIERKPKTLKGRS